MKYVEMTKGRKIYKKRLNGLTLVELIVTMIISSLVVLMAFTCYQITHKQYQDYRNINNNVTQATLLNMLLTRDILLSDKITKGHDGGLLIEVNDSSSVSYTFVSGYILRQKDNNPTDTFPVNSATVSEQFAGNDAEEGGLIDNISIEGKVLGENVFFHFNKEYGADILMEMKNTKSW